MILKDNLIELEQQLRDFRNHNLVRGIEIALDLINSHINSESSPRDGSESMARYYEGYDRAMKEVQNLLKNKLMK